MNCTKYKTLNRILVYRYVKYYNECWKDRNRILHDENKQKERLKRWCENEKQKAENSKYSHVKLYVERSKLDLN